MGVFKKGGGAHGGRRVSAERGVLVLLLGTESFTKKGFRNSCDPCLIFLQVLPKTWFGAYAPLEFFFADLRHTRRVTEQNQIHAGNVS